MRKLTLFTTLGLLSVQLYAQQPLATAHIFSFGGDRGLDNRIRLSVDYQGSPSGERLITNMVWTTAMVGQSFLYTADSGPAFALFVSRLTDGVNAPIGYSMTLLPTGGGGANYSSEAAFLTTHPLDWNGVDLQGYTITAIELRMNQLSFVSPGSNPAGDGNWTDYSFDATLTFYTVPEPGALLLLLGGLGWWWFQARRSRRGGA